MSAFAALVDWGTSSFRLWLVDGAGAVLAERRSGEGMATAGEAAGGFAGVLERQLAAALGFDSISKATGIYHTPEYGAALAAGGMEGGEGHVVNRTICAVEVAE